MQLLCPLPSKKAATSSGKGTLMNRANPVHVSSSAQPGTVTPRRHTVPKWNRPVCNLLGWRARQTLSARLLPRQTRGAAGFPARPVRRSSSADRGVRRSGAWGSKGVCVRRKTRISPNRGRLRGGCSRRVRRPIAGVIDDSPHLLEPPIGASQTAPASPSRLKPRRVCKSQFQLATDHGAPLLSSKASAREHPSGPGKTASGQTASYRGTRPAPCIRE